MTIKEVLDYLCGKTFTAVTRRCPALLVLIPLHLLVASTQIHEWRQGEEPHGRSFPLAAPHTGASEDSG